MKSIAIDSGGPVIPRSKSRATVRSPLSRLSSRWPIPGGRTQAAVSRSCSHALVRSPRLALAAWWIGVRIWSRMKNAPRNASGAPSGAPR